MLYPFDELNAFAASVETKGKSKEDIIDELLDILLLAYAEGSNSAAEMLGINVDADYENAIKTALAATKGKNFIARIELAETPAELIRIAETETHRVYNTAAYETAKKGGATSKTWSTMLDDRVRDTHSYLEGTSIPIDAEFYTADGDHALHPGGFDSADENCNCRCSLIYQK